MSTASGLKVIKNNVKYIYAPKSKIKSRVHSTPEPAWGTRLNYLRNLQRHGNSNINTTVEDRRYKCQSNQQHTHTRLTALCPGLPGWASTRKVKPISILLKQETVSGSGISWAICKSASCSRQITMPAPHHSVFTGRMPFLLPNQPRQSTEVTAINN